MKNTISRAVLAIVCATAVPTFSFAFQETPVYRIGGGVSSPVPIVKPEPQYTEDARSNRIEGDVLVKVIIDDKGVPAEAEIVRSLERGLDLNAVETVLKWRFKPGMKDGKPVRVQATLQISFKLQ